MKKLVLLVVLLSSADLSAAERRNCAADPVPPDSLIQQSLFGVDFGYLLKNQPFPKNKFGIIRLWDSGVTWSLVQPLAPPAPWKFDVMDRIVDSAYANDVKILYTMGQTPAWASSNPTDSTNIYGLGSVYMPKDIQTWRDYVTTIGQRYKGKIQYYEIWNEVDARLFWKGSVQDLAQLTHEAAVILKQIDPKIKIIAPCISSGDIQKGEPVLQSLLPLIKNDIDIVAVHCYPKDKLIPESMVAKYALTKQVMQSTNAGDKELWNTETGFGSRNHPPNPDVIITGNKAKGFIARSYLVTLTQGVSSFHFYRWENAQQGLNVFQDDNVTLNDAGMAYGVIMEWLLGNKLLSYDNSGGLWIAEFEKPSGIHFWIVWSESGTGTFSIPSAWQAATMTIYGDAKTTIGNSLINLDDRPILLEGSNTSSVADDSRRAPEAFLLLENYPNPFNPSTTISYQLPTASRVTLRVFNTLGQEVASLVNGHEAPGYYQVRWNANVPSGIYFYRLQAGQFVETKTMILLK